MRTSLLFASLAVSLLAGACADDPVTFSEPVTINLKVDSDKAVNDSITTEKGITTENANPYGAFIADAQAALGADPSRIDLGHVDILLGADTTGVSSLSEVFDGDVSVLFQMDTTDDTFDAASVSIGANTDGGGPLSMTTSFDSDQMSSASYDKLLSGSFKVVINAPTQADFDTLSAKTTMQLTFEFQAYE